MYDQLIETIDNIIRGILNEDPDTVRDREGNVLARCSEGPAVAFRVMGVGEGDDERITVIYNDKRGSEDAAWHSGIRMSAPPNSYERLRGRLWNDKKILSFYESERQVDGYRAEIEKFFEDIGEDIDSYQVEYGDSAETRGLVKWKRSSRAYKAPKITVPPEIQKKIQHLLPKFHLAAPGPEKDKLKAELDKLYAMAGIENQKEREKQAYLRAAAAKKAPYEKGGGAGMASYTGRLPAIAEDKVRLYNKTLCPELWDEAKHLDPKVRSALLKIAFDFYADTEIQAKVEDVQLLGSAANYNWTPESDVDVHILVDSAQIGMDPETAKKYFRSLSGKWNLEHEIKVKGHPVELYIQDIHEENSATAIYSLVHDKWIKSPEVEKIVVDKPQIQKKYSMWVERINDAIRKKNDVALKKILESLRNYRQAGLKQRGEFSTENLVFKILRARGYLEKLKDAYNDIYDKKMTVRDGFEPTSQGPNPEAGVGEDNGKFYQRMNSKMRGLEESKEDQIWLGWVDPSNHRVIAASGEEVSMHDHMFDTHPETQRLDWEDAPKWRYRKDLNTVYWWGQIPDEDIRESLDLWLKKNLHADKPKHVRLRAVSWSDEDKTNVHRSHGTMEESTGQTTRSKYFTAFWNHPSVAKGSALIMLGDKPPTGVKDPNWFANAWQPWREENKQSKWAINRHKGAFDVGFEDAGETFDTIEDLLAYLDSWWESKGLKEGYGAGKREEDRLKIINRDGSIRRWQIRSKDAPKTPKMTKEISNLVNEVLDKVLPMPPKEGLGLETLRQQKLKTNQTRSSQRPPTHLQREVIKSLVKKDSGKDKILCKTEWVSLREKDLNGQKYHYLHEDRSEGRIVAILPYRRIGKDVWEYGVRVETISCWSPVPQQCSLTGGVDKGDGVVETAVKELREESGYEVLPKDLKFLGVCMGTKSTDTVYFLFAVDLTHKTQGKIKGDPQHPMRKKEVSNGFQSPRV